jgi:hypothetical protein
MFYYRRFLRLTGLNHSTNYHIRIRGYAIHRLTLAVILSVLAAVLFTVGMKMPTPNWFWIDLGILFFSILLAFGAFKVLEPWQNSD